MKAKRSAALFLACLLALSATACGGETENTETLLTETPVETEPEETGYRADYLPDVTYNGYEYRIVCYPEYPKDITEPTGDLVDDAIYTRNMMLEEKYDIAFTTKDIPYNQYLEATELMKNTAMSQSDDFELCVLVLKDAYISVLNGYAPTMDKLPHADMSQPWYYQTLNDKLTFDGIPLLGINSYDLNPGGYGIIFNKTIVETLGLESPYDMVADGTWTMEKMYAMASAAIGDLNGDGQFKLDEDRFGLIGEPDNITTLMYAGSGLTLVEEVDGIPVVSQNEKLIDLFFLYLNSTEQDGILFDPFVKIKWEENSRLLGNEFFTRDGALFLYRNTSVLTSFGDMESDYGLVPSPKASEEQDQYYTPITGGNIAMPLACSADLERVSVIREALAVESLNLVHPAYYENSLQKRYVRDMESIEMMELITANPVLDFGNSIWWDTIRTPWLDCVQNRKDSIVSAVTKNLPKGEKSIQDLMDKVAELKANME